MPLAPGPFEFRAQFFDGFSFPRVRPGRFQERPTREHGEREAEGHRNGQEQNFVPFTHGFIGEQQFVRGRGGGLVAGQEQGGVGEDGQDHDEPENHHPHVHPAWNRHEGTWVCRKT